MERKPYIPEYLEMILEQMKELNQLMKEAIEEKDNKEEAIEETNKEETIVETNKEETIEENASDKPTTKKTKKHKS